LSKEMTMRTKLGILMAILSAVGCVEGQSTGAFVVPAIRRGGGTGFAYWNQFMNPAGSVYNYLYGNPPGLLAAPAGADSAGNLNNVTGEVAVLRQTGSATCFVTSSGALYDYRGRTAFEVVWRQPGGVDREVTNVIFQTMTGGRRFELDNIRLHGVGGDGRSVVLVPDFRALDEPQTGAFDERLVSAFQWDLTGRGVGDFRVVFAAPGDSMPLWQAQLDVVSGGGFERQLGYLLMRRVLPVVRFGNAGRVELDAGPGAETRFFLPGQSVRVEAVPEFGWETVGWVVGGRVEAAGGLEVGFGAADREVTALFAPLDYEAWRYGVFQHGNALLGQANDYGMETVSGVGADPDGDGMPNFAEYAFGGDPYVMDAWKRGAECLGLDGEGRVGVRWRSGVGEAAEMEWRVEVSEDLERWRGAEESGMEVTGREVQADGSAVVTARVRGGSGGRMYLRVVAGQ
jgi:hypothetical protein